MAEHEELAYSVSVHRDDSPVDHDPRNEREGSRESDHDDRDRRRRGGGYERDLRRENRRYTPYPSHDERSSRRPASGGKECRVYVWNLPYAVKWQDLKDFMKKGLSAGECNTHTYAVVWSAIFCVRTEPVCIFI